MADNKKQIQGLITYLLWLLLMLLALASDARGEDRALLIGVGRYAQLDEKLNGVSLDIDMMREFAQLLGFKSQAIKVLEHEYASTEKVYSAVENWLIKGVGPQDRVLFYFSGHGSQIPDENHDENDQFDEVLLLYDAAVKAQSRPQTLTGVLVDDDLNTMLARMHSRNIFVILDACHSGSATRSLRLNPRSISVNDAQVKFFSYSSHIQPRDGQGSFDVLDPKISTENSGRYVAISACRDDEKTIATSQGSIFTLGLRQVVRSAAMAGINITPEEIRRRTTTFIREEIQSDVIAFHPQIAGSKNLRKRPLKLFPHATGSGFVSTQMKNLVYKNNATVWIKLNKTCFEIGDVLKISVWIPEPGYLNIISVDTKDRATVLFPNQFHISSAVSRGKMSIPADHMNFEMITDGATGPNQITAFLTKAPINAYEHGFKTSQNVLATLSPNSTRALALRQKQQWLAAGNITADIRDEGQCR